MAAAIVLSLLLYCNISTLTFASPEFVGDQSVEPPLRSSVDHTPISVAINAQSEFLGSNKAQRTGISGKFPSTAVHVGLPCVALFDSKTLVTP